MNTQEQQNKVLDIIIYLLEGYKNGKTLKSVNVDGDETILHSCGYLLNQTIRQYEIPKSHVFVSEKALETWKNISKNDIKNYAHRDIIQKEIEKPIEIDKYKGEEKRPSETIELKFGDKFVYNDVFTDEHIVTISNIIEELCKLPEPHNYASVKKVLDKIYICKMLKSEDRKIKHRKKRSIEYKNVIMGEYCDVGITVVGFDYHINNQFFDKK